MSEEYGKDVEPHVTALLMVITVALVAAPIGFWLLGW